jgi:hypothetical protein
VNETLPQSAAGEDWVVRYEQLRTAALGHAVSGGFGLVLLLRQGMTGWMRACCYAVPSAPPPVRESDRSWNITSLLPCDVRSQAAVILAGILLSHPTEAILCKATCTR